MASARICLQWTLIVFNTLSVVIGILGIVACIYELQKYPAGSAEYVEKIVQLGAASLLVISAFVGCCGAVNGSIKILLAFISVLLSLIVSHIWKLWRYNEEKQIAATEKILTYAWLEELVKPGRMDGIQDAYECCGMKDSNDYIDLRMQVPPSCYRFENGMQTIYPYEEGCELVMRKAYLDVYRWERTALWCLIGFECLGVLLSIILICKLLTKSRRYNY